MEINELKTWIDSLPAEFSDYQIVFGQAFEDGDQLMMNKEGHEVRSLFLDEENKELVLQVHSDYNSFACNTLRDLKIWIEKAPESASQYDCVLGEIHQVDEYRVRLDKPITVMDVDEVDRQIVLAEFLNQEK